MLIISGLIGLWLGTKWIMSAAFNLAEKFNISHSFVGVAILSVGTDLPEVFVSLQASVLQLRGIESSGIITGNAIGSSICQITFILGVGALLLNFSYPKKDLLRDGIALLSAILLLFIFGADGVITRAEGGLLLIFYSTYYILLLKTQNKNTDNHSDDKNHSFSKLVFFLFAGFIILIFSSHLVVENAMILARKWGVDQSFVGIVIIGLGTSLPELAVSVGAAINKSEEMSVGNIIGSNIFDGFVPIGIGGVISRTTMESNLLRFELPVLFAVTVLVLVFLKTKKGVSKLEGIILIAFFFIYLSLKVFQIRVSLSV